jgi:hypothetical protein
VVHTQLLERAEFLMEICERLVHAQQQYKMYYDHTHRALEFEVGQAEAASSVDGFAGRQGQRQA